MIQIKDKADCCGCTACSSACSHNAITMFADTEGFKYPQVNSNLCINCGLCEKVCPLINRDITSRKATFKEIYACRLKDEELLKSSSSGGAFTAIAHSILESGGVVYGATYTASMEVKHIVVESEEDLYKLRGSKYVQSNLDLIFHQVRSFLKGNRLVLFSGTPCQVDGLKKFLLREYDNLYTVDIVCHAVASPKVFKDYVGYVNKMHSDCLVWINMRDKEKRGWGHLFSQRLRFENKGDIIDSSKVLGWNHLFFSQFFNRPSCYACRYCNLDRPGDFTISDLWDDNNTLPSLVNDKGTSMLMLNTAKATKQFDNIKDSIDYQQISIDTCLQPNLQSPTPAREDRYVFWDYYNKKDFHKTYNHFFKKKMTPKRFIKKTINYILLHIFGK